MKVLYKLARVFLLLSLTITFTCCFICCSEDHETVVDSKVRVQPILPKITGEMNYAEVEALKPGTPIKIRTVLNGTTPVDLNGAFMGISENSGLGFPLYECQVKGEPWETYSGIVAGMSGSPVIVNNRIIGALAYGFDNTTLSPYMFLATPIENIKSVQDMKSLDDYLLAPAKTSSAGIVPLKTPLSIGTGKFLPSNLSLQNFLPYCGISSGVETGKYQSEGLEPGSGIAISLVRGPICNFEASGTITWIDQNRIYAFGHPFLLSGKIQAPFRGLRVEQIISSNIAPFKFSSGIGPFLGTIDKDFYPGISGALNVPTPMIDLIVKYKTPAIQKEITHEVAPGCEWIIPQAVWYIIDTLRNEISTGSVRGSVTLKFNETEKQYTEKLFLSSYDTTYDVTAATQGIIMSFTDRLSNSAGKATLKKITLDINEEPAIRIASIDSIDAPDEATVGETIQIKVNILPHWTAAKQERVLQQTVSLEIPADFPMGKASLTASIASAAGGTDTENKNNDGKIKLPRTLDELIQEKISKQEVDPGKIIVTLTSSGEGDIDLLPENETTDTSNVEPLTPTSEVKGECIFNGFIITGDPVIRDIIIK